MCGWVTHTLGGGVLWVGGTWVASAVFHVDVAPAAVLVGTPVAFGAAQWPDTDHPNSGIAHAVGPVSEAICRQVSKRFHHRGPTHYLVAVPVWALLATLIARIRLDILELPARLLADRWPDNDPITATHTMIVQAGDWQLGLFAVVALLSAWGLRALSPDLDHSCDGTGEVVLGVAIAAAAFAWVPLGGWVPAAVAVGVLSHDLEDLLTRGPFRFLWPLPWRFSAGLFTTGHAGEHVVVSPILVAVLAVLLWVRAVHPLAVEAHTMLAAFTA